MESILETLVSYIPRAIVQHTLETREILTGAHVDRYPAAVLYLDTSNFAAEARRMNQSGSSGSEEGVEELYRLINAYFSEVIDIAAAHRGEVFQFNESALIAIWPGRPVNEESVVSVTRRAAQCALDLKERLHTEKFGLETKLSLRICLGAGEIFIDHVGGVEDRWVYLISGKPLMQINAMLPLVQPDEIGVTAEAWNHLRDYLGGHNRGDGSARLTEVLKEIPRVSASKVLPMPEAEDAFRSYIPRAVLSGLSGGQASVMAEIRRLTVLYVALPGFDYNTALVQSQKVVQIIQNILYHYEGEINRLFLDDTGLNIIAVLGLPPLAHEDDAARGAQCALSLQLALNEVGITSAMGVSTGRAFCGEVGNNIRKEYMILGALLEIGERLAQLAFEDIFCDRATVESARSLLVFEELPAVPLKGKSELIQVYRPLKQEKLFKETKIVGRDLERNFFRDQLASLRTGGQGRILLIEGEAGIGKSRLIGDLKDQAEALGLTVFVGSGDAVERSTPYYAWRNVFSHLFDLEVLNGAQARRRHILDLLELEPDLLPLAPLLNDVLLLELPDNEITAQMTGQRRADSTRDLLLKSLQASVARSPKVLILEDVHWLDSASWALALLIRRQVRPLFFVLTLRPPEGPLSPEYEILSDDIQTKFWKLDGLSKEETLDLICQRLGVGSLPQAVENLISEKAQGNPFFSEELAYALRDSGGVTISDGECHLRSETDDLRELRLPETMQGMITSRIDRLTAGVQLTLKVASILGRVFSFQLLQDIYPVVEEKDALPGHLDILIWLDILALETPEPGRTYIFKHIIAQEAAYNLVLSVQRKQLHRAIAEWYEKKHSDDLSPFYPLLAHHLKEAGLISPSIEYFVRAGEQALRNYANQEAIDFFSQALLLERKEDEAVGKKQEGAEKVFLPVVHTLRRARWERQLAEAYFALGRLTRSEEHLKRALLLLGWPLPINRTRLFFNVAEQIIKQLGHSIHRPKMIENKEEKNTSLAEAARIFERLGEIKWFGNEGLLLLYAAFHSLNLAEASGIGSEMARGYANISFGFGLSGLGGLSRSYANRAFTLAGQLEQPATLSYVLARGSAYAIGRGEWEKGEKDLAEAIAHSANLGDRRLWEESLTLRALVAHYRAQYTVEGKVWEELHQEARRSGHNQVRAWSLWGQAQSYLYLGETVKAIALAEEALIVLGEVGDRSSEIVVHGILALAYWRQERKEEALRELMAGEKLIAQSSPSAFSILEGYTDIAMVRLSFLSEALDRKGSELSLLREGAKQACAELTRFARKFPIGQPRAWLCQGIYALAKGDVSGARRYWQRTVERAEKLDLPYEQGLAYYQLGKNAVLNDPLREGYIRQAFEIFTRLQASYELKQLEKLTTVYQ